MSQTIHRKIDQKHSTEDAVNKKLVSAFKVKHSNSQPRAKALFSLFCAVVIGCKCVNLTKKNMGALSLVYAHLSYSALVKCY